MLSAANLLAEVSVTQEHAAAQLGVPQITIRRALSGRRPLPMGFGWNLIELVGNRRASTITKRYSKRTRRVVLKW